MKKWYMGLLLDPDEKDSAGGSSDSATDDTADSSSDNSTENSESKKVEKEPTLADVAQAAYKASVEKQSEATAEGEAEKGEILSSNPTDKEADEEASESADKDKTEEAEKKDEEKEDGTEEKSEEVEKGPVPYERFQEVVKERQTVEQKLKEYEPLAEAHRSVVEYCKTNQITEEQFRDGMEILRLVNTDPVAARKAIEPIWNQLNGLTGDSLPADLQQEVTDGLISEARAKELARLRGQSQIQSSRTKLSAEQQAKQQQEAFARELGTTINSWTQSKQTTDPDFKPKAGPNAPDGKFEFVADRYYKLLVTNPPTTVAAAMKLVEQAYADVSRSFSSLVPKAKPSSKGISSTKSSTNSKTEPKSIKDVVANVLARHSA